MLRIAEIVFIILSIILFLFSMTLVSMQIYSRFKLYGIKKKIILTIKDHNIIFISYNFTAIFNNLTTIFTGVLSNRLINLACVHIFINIVFFIMHFTTKIVFFNDSIFAQGKEIIKSRILGYKFENIDDSISYLILTCNENKVRNRRLRIATEDIKSVEDLLKSWITPS